MDRGPPDNQPRIAIIWRGSDTDPGMSERYQARLQPVFEALRRQGCRPEPLVYFDCEAERVRARLRAVEAALVWVNPLSEGQTRTTLDVLLREASADGAFVNAHPDVIDRMGVKRVLYDTRDLGWGADTDLHESPEALAALLPSRLDRPRVLKPLRGNDGQGVVKLQRFPDGKLRLQRASDDGVETLSPDELIQRLMPMFAQGGAVIEQPFNDNAAAGMVRCYMVQDRVAGFAVQRPRREAEAFAMQSDKTMHPPEHPDLQDLREAMEQEWTPGMQRILGISRHRLPMLWDADFLHRPPAEAIGRPRFMLCEINCSCVSPFPPSVPEMLAEAVAKAISWRGRQSTFIHTTEGN